MPVEVAELRKFFQQGFVPGPFALSRGKLLVLGMGQKIADYEPPALFTAPDSPSQFTREHNNGTDKLYGTILTHAAQQLYAVRYAQSNMGFADQPLTFKCHWAWFEPGLITVAVDGSFVQEETESRL